MPITGLDVDDGEGRTKASGLAGEDKTRSEALRQVLVVDDEESYRKLVAQLLVQFGFGCRVAISGEEALNYFESGDFDLVLTDFQMPGMNGNQFAEKVKSLKPNIRVILASGSPPLAISPAIDAVLSKPFTATQLRDAIQMLVARSV